MSIEFNCNSILMMRCFGVLIVSDTLVSFISCALDVLGKRDFEEGSVLFSPQFLESSQSHAKGLHEVHQIIRGDY